MRRSRAPGRWLTLFLVLLRSPALLWRRKPRDIRHVLVLHHLLLGDCIMVTPLLAKLRERYPNANLRMACPTAFVPLYAHRPYGVEAIAFDPREVATMLRLLRGAKPDLVLLPADNRYAWLAFALGARWIVGFAGDKPNWKNWLLDEQRPYSPIPTAWGDTCAELLDGPRPHAFQAADWPAPPAEAFSQPAAPYAVLHLGASSSLKHWEPEKWQALAAKLAQRGFRVIWSAGAAEVELVQAVDPQGQYQSLAGKLDLAQLWTLLAQASLLVCPDTGVAHLGRVANVPTVTLFGPGSALMCGAGDFWRDSPYRAVTVADFPCRDQQIQYLRVIEWVRRCERFPGSGDNQCGAARCMQGITVDAVWAASGELLGFPRIG